MPLTIKDKPCPRRAIREMLADSDNMERMLKYGISMPPHAPLEIEVWKAMDDMLHITSEMERDILADPSYDAWYVPKYHRMMVKAHRRVTGYPIPMGRTLDETAKIMRGVKKFLILYMWYGRKGRL